MDKVKTLVRCDEDGVPCIVQAIRPEGSGTGWVRFYDGITIPYRCHESQNGKGGLYRLEAVLGRIYEGKKRERESLTRGKIVVPHSLS